MLPRVGDRVVRCVGHDSRGQALRTHTGGGSPPSASTPASAPVAPVFISAWPVAFSEGASLFVALGSAPGLSPDPPSIGQLQLSLRRVSR